MTKYFFHNLICILLLVGLLNNSCIGQQNTNSQKEKSNKSNPGPEIIGAPPPLVSFSNQVSDTGLVGQYIRAIFQDSKGNYWFGPAGQSVAMYDTSTSRSTGKKTLKYFSKDEFFHGNDSVVNDNVNSVYAIAEDKNGNIWFGTDYGVIKYNPSTELRASPSAELRAGGKAFRSYSIKNGLSNINVGRKSILVDKSGNIWVGTHGGVFRYNAAADTTGGKCFSQFDLLPPISVKGIMEDNSGNIWFATHDKGVYRYDPKAKLRKSEEIINIAEKEGLGDNYAGGMAQDKSGNFWFTFKGGICKYDPSAGFTEITPKEGLGGSEFWGIFIEQSGIIWITARGSATRFDPSVPTSNPKAFTVFTVDDGINCCVQSMYQDKSGNMWWGTGQGLYRFDGKRFYQVKQNGPW